MSSERAPARMTDIVSHESSVIYMDSMGADHLGDDAVLAFVQDQATEQEAAAVTRHIDECADCRRVLAETALYYFEGTVAREVPERFSPAELAQSRYVPVGVLGSGASGVVYGAFDARLDRKVALKLLREGVGSELTHSERFLAEAQVLARLGHPNVVAVHDVGTMNDRVFIAMELVDGITLSSWLHASVRPYQEVVVMFKQIAQGLAAAHGAGVVHGDFKPEKVLIGDDRVPRIVDFGLAAAVDTTSRTSAYAAPEQLDGKSGGAAADQFSLCAALYEALFGASPFAGETIAERTAALMAGRVRRPPKGNAVSSRLRRAVQRGLGVAPSDRHPSLIALIEALDRETERAATG